MIPLPSCWRAAGGADRLMPLPRRAGGLPATNTRACVGGRRAVADAVGTVGRCTRVACAAVIALVLLGDNISARAPPHSGSGHEQQAAWQFFSPSLKAPSNPSRSAALQQGTASLPSSPDAKRRGRLQVASTVAAGSAVSPAQMYRVSPSGGPGRLTLPGDSSRDAAREEGLQSPRSAIAGAGRDYPELLTVYSAAPSSIAEEIGEGVVAGGGEFGRPALPLLCEEDLTQLRAGQRVQKQTREGGSGSGSVVVDVRADPDVVLGLLTKYEDYAEMIDTVRRCEVFPEGDEDNRMVEVTVSRFRLHIRVVMSLLRERSMVKFELDPGCTKAGRAVLREATGFFFVESPPDRPGYSRVWMLAKVEVNRFVPGGVVDYAAGRALPRASNWIKPTCEAAQRRKLRENGSSGGAA